MSLEELFIEAVEVFNGAVFPGEQACTVHCRDVFDLPRKNFAIAYLDPPYAPPKDDTCYVKRYHFLEGLATYWHEQEIMWETRTRKIKKRHTPFAYKRTAGDALDRMFGHFEESALVVSYGSNAAISADELVEMLRNHRRFVRRVDIPHSYAFGTHGTAKRRQAIEHVFVATQ
jgi:DNA adenine methylase/adenine-specific DNA-methyltransferase